jgi:hypothetical protein
MKKVLSNPFVVAPNFVMVSIDAIAKRELMTSLV